MWQNEIISNTQIQERTEFGSGRPFFYCSFLCIDAIIHGKIICKYYFKFKIRTEQSHITPSSYVSHHTAMEYYGITDQVYYEVYVSSETSFRDFTFDGYTYCFVASKSSEGIEKPPYSGGVAVTNLERTIVDSIKDMDKIAGIEEVVQNIENIHRMQEKRLLKYLELYQNQFLYQKMGYLLWQHKDKMGLSDYFFQECKEQIGKSKRYLTRDQAGGRYVDEWRLIIPDDLTNMKNGVWMDADI